MAEMTSQLRDRLSRLLILGSLSTLAGVVGCADLALATVREMGRVEAAKVAARQSDEVNEQVTSAKKAPVRQVRSHTFIEGYIPPSYKTDKHAAERTVREVYEGVSEFNPQDPVHFGVTVWNANGSSLDIFIYGPDGSSIRGHEGPAVIRSDEFSKSYVESFREGELYKIGGAGLYGVVWVLVSPNGVRRTKRHFIRIVEPIPQSHER